MAGLHIAARLRLTGEAEDIVRRAAAAGLGVRSIAEFATGPGAPAGLVFGYGVVAERDVETAVQRLGTVLRLVATTLT